MNHESTEEIKGTEKLIVILNAEKDLVVKCGILPPINRDQNDRPHPSPPLTGEGIKHPLLLVEDKGGLWKKPSISIEGVSHIL